MADGIREFHLSVQAQAKQHLLSMHRRDSTCDLTIQDLKTSCRHEERAVVKQGSPPSGEATVIPKPAVRRGCVPHVKAVRDPSQSGAPVYRDNEQTYNPGTPSCVVSSAAGFEAVARAPLGVYGPADMNPLRHASELCTI